MNESKIGVRELLACQAKIKFFKEDSIVDLKKCFPEMEETIAETEKTMEFLLEEIGWKLLGALEEERDELI